MAVDRRGLDDPITRQQLRLRGHRESAPCCPLPLPTRLLEAVAVSSMMSAITVVPEPNGRHRKKGILTEPGWCGGTTRQLKDTNKPDQWQLRRTQKLGSGKSLGKPWRRINQTCRNSGKPCGASGQGINLLPKLFTLEEGSC